MDRITVVLLLVAFVFTPCLVLATEEGRTLEEMVVKMIDTPPRHSELARHYHVKAEEARAQMRLHQEMARSYGDGKMSKRRLLKRHCQNISEKYGKMAKHYDALAKLHKMEAKKSE
jgi:hypothetical protein